MALDAEWLDLGIEIEPRTELDSVGRQRQVGLQPQPGVVACGKADGDTLKHGKAGGAWKRGLNPPTASTKFG